MKIIILAMLTFMSLPINAQKWETDIVKAKNLAAKEHKNILLVFSGSDWCAPCIKLEREIWENKEFQELSKNDFIMLRADFPRRKKNRLSKEQEKQNSNLAEKYNIGGVFPLVVVLDKNGNVLGKIGYKKNSPKIYYQELTAFIK